MTHPSADAPDFSSFRAVELRSLSGDGVARLVRADTCVEAAGVATERGLLIAQLTEVCNEPLIFDRLFRPRRGGVPYSPAEAEQFLDRCVRGWREGTHFVFFIIAADGSPAARRLHGGSAGPRW